MCSVQESAIVVSPTDTPFSFCSDTSSESCSWGSLLYGGTALGIWEICLVTNPNQLSSYFKSVVSCLFLSPGSVLPHLVHNSLWDTWRQLSHLCVFFPPFLDKAYPVYLLRSFFSFQGWYHLSSPLNIFQFKKALPKISAWCFQVWSKQKILLNLILGFGWSSLRLCVLFFSAGSCC